MLKSNTLLFAKDVLNGVDVRHFSENDLDLDFLKVWIWAHGVAFFFLPISFLNPTFKDYCQNCGLRVLQQQKAMGLVCSAFLARSIRFVFLKGIPLNHLLYGDSVKRVSCDIDMLIHPEDSVMAHEEMLRLGFELITPFTPEDIQKSNWRMDRWVVDFGYRHSKLGVCFELHRQLTVVTQLTLEPAMIQTVTLFGRGLPVLIPEYEFVYLCIHGAKSQWAGYRWLVDILDYIKTVTLSPEKVYQIATDLGVLRLVIEAIQLVEVEFGVAKFGLKWGSWLDRVCVKVRRPFIRSFWVLKRQNVPILSKIYMLFLYPRWSQKGHLILGCYLRGVSYFT